ncbi:MAG: hypothetical protein ACRCXM_13475, partial [Beijerinckiaceae bacterium]
RKKTVAWLLPAAQPESSQPNRTRAGALRTRLWITHCENSIKLLIYISFYLLICARLMRCYKPGESRAFLEPVLAILPPHCHPLNDLPAKRLILCCFTRALWRDKMRVLPTRNFFCAIDVNRCHGDFFQWRQFSGDVATSPHVFF